MSHVRGFSSILFFWFVSFDEDAKLPLTDFGCEGDFSPRSRC